jgi:hypothetical protein
MSFVIGMFLILSASLAGAHKLRNELNKDNFIAKYSRREGYKQKT